MRFNVLTQRGTVISRSTIQRVANIKKKTSEVKDMFQKFDEAVQKKIKSCSYNGYLGDKPNPNRWEDLIENGSVFR